MEEFEMKYMLSKRQFRLLREFVKNFYKYQFKCSLQTNFYYDTPDWHYNQSNTTIRIREKNGKLCGTIKYHAEDEYGSNKENLFCVKTVPTLLKYEDNLLSMKGKLVTNRMSVLIAPTITLCLDENFYLGTRDYELEIEYDEGARLDAWKYLVFLTMLVNDGRFIPTQSFYCSTHKSTRFFARLKKKGKRHGIRD